MARTTTFADSISGTAALTREADPTEKGEPLLREEREIGSAVSEPLSVAPEMSAGHAGTKRKAAPDVPPKDLLSYQEFRRLCDDLFSELQRIEPFFLGDELSDAGAEVVTEVEALLEALYICKYGSGESLKRIVVAIQSQVNNAPWDKRHVTFLRDIIGYLRVRYLVDESVVSACYDMIKAAGLNQFRGTVSEPRVVKRYRIEEVVDHDDSGGKRPA